MTAVETAPRGIDAVLAIIITIMVLQPRAAEDAHLSETAYTKV